MEKMSLLRLAAVLPVLVLCFSVMVPAAYAAGTPLPIYGYVTYNGANVAGATVSAGNSQATTDGNGFYQLTPSVENGSSVTVTADYNGHTKQASVMQHNQGSVQVDLAITYQAPTATATATPTATANPNNGGNSYSNSLESYGYEASATPTATPTTIPETSSDATPVPATPTPEPSATSSPTAASGHDGNTTLYLVLGLIVVLALVGAGYLYFRKQ